MFIQTWGEVFTTSLQSIWAGFIGFVPNLIVAIIIFIVGWVIGAVIGKALERLSESLKLDKLFESIGTGEMLQRAGLKLNIGKFIGETVKWFIIIVFLVASLDVLKLHQVNVFLNQVLQYLPQVIIAVLILVIVSVVSIAMRKFIESSVKAAYIKSSTAKFLGTTTYYAIWVFGIIIALSELGIAAQFMQILFTGIVVAGAIAVGLAFGLGGKDAAKDVLDKVRRDI